MKRDRKGEKQKAPKEERPANNKYEKVNQLERGPRERRRGEMEIKK